MLNNSRSAKFSQIKEVTTEIVQVDKRLFTQAFIDLGQSCPCHLLSRKRHCLENAMIRAFVVFAFITLTTLMLTACGEPGDDDIVDGGRPDSMTQPDGQVTIDAGTPDVPQLDVCQQQDPPPQGAYVMMGKELLCGEMLHPGDHTSWAFLDVNFACQLDVHPDTETGAICVVLCPGHFGADYSAITIERAGLNGPYRFYYTPPGSIEMVCYDPRTLPSQS